MPSCRSSLDRGKKPAFAALQTLPAVEMEQVEKSSDCSSPVGCYTTRSVLPLPNGIDYSNGVGITFVGTADGSD